MTCPALLPSTHNLIILRYGKKNNSKRILQTEIQPRADFELFNIEIYKGKRQTSAPGYFRCIAVDQHINY